MKAIEQALTSIKGKDFDDDLEDISSGYRLKESIGKGNFGQVRKALHIDTEIEVAVKILDKLKMIEHDDSERVKREIDILSRVNHPNIAYLYEILDEEEFYFFVLEYCKGGNLSSYIASKGGKAKDENGEKENKKIYETPIKKTNFEKFDEIITPNKRKSEITIEENPQNENKESKEKGRLSEKEACKFYCQMISALSYLHEMGIVHRDIKPENLLLDDQNNLKLIDFGLGNLYSERHKLSTPCGSPCYAPPEMITGVDYDPLKTDVWSSGITLFVMLTGDIPFKENTIDSLYRTILKKDLKYPDYLSQNAVLFLECLLKKDPQKRPNFEEAFQHQWIQENKPINYDFFSSVKSREKLLDENEEAQIYEDLSVFYKKELDFVKKFTSVNLKNCVSSQFFLISHQKERLKKCKEKVKRSFKSSKKKRILKKMPLKVKSFQNNSNKKLKKDTEIEKNKTTKAKIDEITQPFHMKNNTVLTKKLKFSNILENRRNTKKKILNKKLGFFKETLQKNLRLDRKRSSMTSRGEKNIRKPFMRKERLTKNNEKKSSKRREFFKRKRNSKLGKENDNSIINGQIKLQISRNSKSRESSLNFTFKDKSFNLTRNLSVKLKSFTSRNKRENLVKNQISPRSISSKIKSGNYSNNRSRTKKKLSNGNIEKRRLKTGNKKSNNISSFGKEKSYSREGKRRFKDFSKRNQTLENIFKSAIKKIPNLRSRKNSVRSRTSINSFENHFFPKIAMKNSINSNIGSQIEIMRMSNYNQNNKENEKNLVHKIAYNIAPPLSARSYSKCSINTPNNRSFRYTNSISRQNKEFGKNVKFIIKDQGGKFNRNREDDYNYGYIKKMSHVLKKSKVGKKRQISKFTLRLDDLQKKLKEKF